MFKKRHYTMVLLLFLAIVITDQASKWLAIQYLRDTGTSYRFAYDMFVLVYAENKGAFLGLGSELPPVLRQVVMVGANAAILLCLAIYLLTVKGLPLFMTTALSLITAGGLGNLIDRVCRGGIVVDFMNVGISFNSFSLRSGVFNIADIAIVAGLLMVVLHELLFHKQEQEGVSRGNVKPTSASKGK